MSLNNTVGDANANCYCSVDEATTYFSDRAHAEAWEEYESKEQVLITASSLLDWYVNFKGTKATDTQSMQFPRIGVQRPDGTLVASDIIPSEVKVATYELALSSLTEDRTVESGLSEIDQIKVSSLMIKAKLPSSGSNLKDTIPEKIWRILSDLTNRNAFGIIRLVRA